MATYDSQLQALKTAHDAMLKAAQDFDAAVTEDTMILKGASRNLVSIVRGIPVMLNHHLAEQQHSDAVAAQVRPAPRPVSPIVAVPPTTSVKEG